MAPEPTTVLVGAAIVVGSLMTMFLRYINMDRPDNLPTLDSTLPIFGDTIHLMFKHRHCLLDWVSEETAKLGGKPWLLSVIGQPPLVILSNPDDFEDIIVNHSDSIERGVTTPKTVGDFLGRGILTTDGAEWYFQRKVSSHLFSMKMMQQVMHEVVREKAALLCKVLDVHVERGEPVSLTEVFMHFTSDVFAKIGFGVELHCLEDGLEGKTHEFIGAYVASSGIIKRRFEQPEWMWKLKRCFGWGDEAALVKHLKIVNSFAYEMIAASMAAKSDTSNKGTNGEQSAVASKDLVSLFLTSSMKDERAEIFHGDQQVEMEFIRDMAINFIFAGKDSTSVGIAWFLVMMARYPEALAKIRAEMADKVPGLLDGSIAVPTIDDLKPLVYLEAAIRENLRLNAPAHVTPRSVIEDIVLRDGTRIPKGYKLLFEIYVSGRQPTVWGPDAAEFKPERWIDPISNSIKTSSPFKSFNFIAGPNMCPGRKMAVMEMKVALAMLLTRFDFKTVEDPFEVTYTDGISLTVKGSLLARVSKYVESSMRETPLGA